MIDLRYPFGSIQDIPNDDKYGNDIIKNGL